MNNLQKLMKDYLDYCKHQKRLDAKTLKAYQIDLKQFCQEIETNSLADVTPAILENFIAKLHMQFKPKTVKRKIATVKAFFHYLEYKEFIQQNPFSRIQVRFREPVILPKTVPLYTVEKLLSTIYRQEAKACTYYQKRNALRDAAVVELLFCTGIRISELCTLVDIRNPLCYLLITLLVAVAAYQKGLAPLFIKLRPHPPLIALHNRNEGLP